MSTAISVWSRVLTPGQDALVSEEVSIQITNVVLEFDESKPASEKRSTVKMQHLTANPALLRAAAAAGYDSDEFDSEIDSDEFGESDDEDDDEDDEDEDEAMADTSKISKASKASTSSKASKVNGDMSTASAGADAEDDEDEDDSDDEFDEEFERQEAEVQICSFVPGKVEQFTTNLILPGEEDFVFKLTGEYKVHLFGHYIMQPVPGAFDEPPRGYGSEGDEYDSDEDEDDYISESELGRYDPETGLLLDEDDDDEDDEDESRFMEIEEAKPAPKKAAKETPAPKKEAAAAKTAPAKAAEPAAASTSAAETVDKSKLSKNQLKKLAKKEKAGEAPAAAEKKDTPATAAAAPKKEEAKPATKAPSATKKQTLPSGLIIEDNKVGTGSVAKSGNRVQMRYIGKLANGKIFDQNTKGAPFSFKLGKGEVIKGWDVGVAGMQVGGERKLVIPAALAYGKQAISGIPPNSTLTFEVKLMSIK